MRSNRITNGFVWAIAGVVVFTAGYLVDEVVAVQCPSGGAQLEVCVKNPDPNNAITGVTVSGNTMSPGVTCTSASNSYTHNFSSIPASNTSCALVAPSGGLNSGMFVHRIEVASTGQVQHQKRPVMHASSGNETSIEWKYYPMVYTVDATSDPGGGSCPLNGTSGTCDIRSAIDTVNALNSTNDKLPALIQFTASPGSITNADLVITRGIIDAPDRNVTIDGTDENGDPWIVADPNAADAGNQDPFPTSLVFHPAVGFHIVALNVTLRGLEIAHDTSESGPQQHLVRLHSNSYGARIESSLLDGRMDQDCGGINPNDCGEPWDLVHVPTGMISNTPAPHITLANVEGRSAVDHGVDAFRRADVSITDSWFHNNYQGNIRVNTPDSIALTNSVVELAGVRYSDGTVMDSSASGIDAFHAGTFVTSLPSTAATYGNVVRNNPQYGVRAAGALMNVFPQNDYICGNGSHGALVELGGFPSGEAVLNGSGGIVAAYNVGNGFRVHSIASAPASLNFSSAFISNDECGLYNASSGTTISARFNQWRGSTAPYDDECETGSSPAPGVVDASNESVPDSSAVLVDSTVPTNVVFKGQTIRVIGDGFNAITGNPVPSIGCSYGIENSCCTDEEKANSCPPSNGSGNCVELRDAIGNWHQVAGRSLTPRMIETDIAQNVASCLGGSGEQIRVSKSDGAGGTIQDQTSYCRSN